MNSNLAIAGQVARGGRGVNFSTAFTPTHTSEEFQAAPVELAAGPNDWTQITAAAVTTVKQLVLAVDSDADFSVEYATVDGSSNKIVVCEIEPGDGIKLGKVDKTKVFARPTGNAAVVVDVLAIGE